MTSEPQLNQHQMNFRRDKLSEDERRGLERLRESTLDGGDCGLEDVLDLIDIIDRLAPRPGQ